MDQLCILSRIRSEAELAGQVICIKGSKLLRRNGKCREEVELLGQFIQGSVIKGSKLLAHGELLRTAKNLSKGALRTRPRPKIGTSEKAT